MTAFTEANCNLGIHEKQKKRKFTSTGYSGLSPGDEFFFFAFVVELAAKIDIMPVLAPEPVPNCA